MKQECIMKQFDFITSKTLDTLTEEQYNLFRDYLKICGLRVIDGHGIYTYVKKIWRLFGWRGFDTDLSNDASQTQE